MINPIKSIIVRNQKRISNNFSSSKYGRVLAKYKSTNTGEKCFIIGNGPSLSGNDLTVLCENNMVSFAANRVFRIFDDTQWRPDYYVCEDEFILDEIWKELPNYEIGEVFIPIAAKWYRNVNLKEVNYYLQKFNSNDEKAQDNKIIFSDDISSFIMTRSSVIVTCIQIAMYMGFKDIYLIGVDHSFSHMKDKDGNIIVDNSIKDHFGNQKNGNSDTKGIFNVDATTKAFMDIKQYADSKGVEIYNATRGGKLEVFPRVDFDHLFK